MEFPVRFSFAPAAPSWNSPAASPSPQPSPPSWSAPQAPSQGYGGPQTPAPGYGGAQATPASPYGGGQTPPPSYGSPQAPSAGYGGGYGAQQAAPGPGYGAPQAPSPGYGGAGYGAAQAPGPGYGGRPASAPADSSPIYGSPQAPTPGFGSPTPVYGGSAGGQAWQPYAGSNGRRRGPRWLLVAGISAVVAAIIAAVIVSTQGGHHAAVVHPTVGPSASATTARPTASATPTTGNLLLDQLQVGDCLKGADLDLNTDNPWPKLSLAVPCSQGHTAEVFYANNNFFPKNGSYPGDKAISKAGTTACDNAFQAYVGIAYSKSQYTWTNIIPDASTWPNPNGDRALHCVAYYSTSAHPAGATLTGSIKGTDQ